MGLHPLNIAREVLQVAEVESQAFLDFEGRAVGTDRSSRPSGGG